MVNKVSFDSPRSSFESTPRSSIDLACSSSDSFSPSASFSKLPSTSPSSSPPQILNEVLFRKEKNNSRITERRHSMYKNPPKQAGGVDEIIQSLPQVKEDVSPILSRLTKRASLCPNKTTHIRKKSTDINKTNRRLTVTEQGDIFMHVPNSTFDVGGFKEVGAAININTGEVLVSSIEKVYLYFGQNADSADSLHHVKGDLRVKERCSDCENLVKGIAFTSREKVELGVWTRNVHSIMEYCGENLHRKVFKGRVFYKVAIGIAKGIQCMHKAGLVHRDIKPSNMFYFDGVPKLGDFGTVGALEDLNTKNDKSFIDFTRITDGTSAYKPPETAKSSHHIHPFSEGKVDSNEFYNAPIATFERKYPLVFAQKGDIFSLGVSLLQLSRPLFNPADESSSDKIVAGVTQFRRIPDHYLGLDRLIFRMLNSNPERRPAIDAVLIELERLKDLHKNDVSMRNTIGVHRFFC